MHSEGERRIRILRESVANQIAAGEVVERPASVVKELVENSIDAESKRILVTVRHGGRELIQVNDDGYGMASDEALLSLERHATSKIWNAEDLASIGSLGFRGEALPSIAAVSKFVLRTRTSDADHGVEIFVEGGTIRRVTDIPCTAGTEIAVRRIFFNLPARRKFLRTPQTELGHIVDTITNLGLAHDNIQFRLLHNDSLILDMSDRRGFTNRVIQLLGSEVAKDLIELSWSSSICRVEGMIGNPRRTMAGRRHQRFFVNGRPVHNATLSNALYGAYRRKIPDRRHPIAFIRLRISPDLVDVNVHPAKSEVRFHNPNEVHNSVLCAVQRALDTTLHMDLHPETRHQIGGQSREPAIIPDRPIWGSLPIQTRIFPEGKRVQLTDSAGGESVEKAAEVELPARIDLLPGKKSEPDFRFREPAFRIIGQLHSTFILIEQGEDLLIVDQHTAHERILYDELSAAKRDSDTSVQRLLIPVILELSPRDVRILMRYLPDYTALGFRIEPFGPNTFRILSAPSVLPTSELSLLLQDLIDDFQEMGYSDRHAERMDKMITQIACKSAIKANTPLSKVQVEALVNKLLSTSQPATCPHGRPIVMRVTNHDILKYFKRI